MKNILWIVFAGVVGLLIGVVLVFVFFSEDDKVVIKEVKYINYETNVRSIADATRKSVISLIPKSKNTSLLFSGVVISENGYILSHKNVFKPGEDYIAIDYAGKEYDILDIKEDVISDLVVVKLSMSPLDVFYPLQVEDIEDVYLGDKAFIVGNSFNRFDPFLQFVTILDDGRKVYGDEKKESIIGKDYFQLDTFLDSQYNGAALITPSNKLLGIVISNESNTWANVIPVFDIFSVLASLEEFKEIKRAKLGISYSMLKGFENVPVNVGAKVEEVGDIKIIKILNDDEIDIKKELSVKKGDIITKIDDIHITSHSTLHQVLKKFLPGDTVELEIFRYDIKVDGKIKQKHINDFIEENTFVLKVVLGEY